MSNRISFKNSNEIGVFLKLTNTYCLAPKGANESFYASLSSTICETPLITTSIASTNIIGRLTAGNSKGLVLPCTASELETKRLRKKLDDSVKVSVLDDTLSALGNCIVCNDSVGLIHPDFDYKTEELIADTLDVDVFRTTLMGIPLVGSFCVLNNSGGLIHPLIEEEELEEVINILDIPICGGTVNRGSDVIGSGLVTNDFISLCGTATTANEISVIENVLRLNEVSLPESPSGLRSHYIESLAF